MGQERYPALSALVELVDTIPVQKACAERGISSLNRIKTKLRSSLEQDSLTALMTMVNNGVDVKDWSEESAVRAVHLWFCATTGTRHIHGHKAGSGRKKKTPEASGGSSSDET